MTDWKQKFNPDTLERGRTLYRNGRVTEFQETARGYSAAVLGRTRFDVSVTIKDGKAAVMSCRCPMARSGGRCEHMAALMYKLEAQQQAEEQNKKEAELLEEWKRLDAEVRADEERRREAAAAKKEEALWRRMQRKKKKEEQQNVSVEKVQDEAETGRKPEQQNEKEEEARRKALEEEQKREQEKAARKEARELRKAETARREAERKQLAEETRKKAEEKRKAEEARREGIRRQKAEEARKRLEKKQREEELTRQAEQRKRREQKKREEELARQAEEERKAEMQKRAELQKQEEEKRRLAEKKQRGEEEYRAGYSLYGGQEEASAERQDLEEENERIEQLENYSYFNIDKIRASLKLSWDIVKKGEKLYQQKKIVIREMTCGYDQYSDDMRGQIEAVGSEGGREFPVTVIFSQNAVLHSRCNCKACQSTYEWYTMQSSCAYVDAALRAMKDYAKEHRTGDATDKKGLILMEHFRQGRANRIIAENLGKKESLQLEPRLVRKAGRLQLSFKVGTGKLFVVKKLDEFCEHVKNSETDTYGASTQINHSLSNFNRQGQEWVRFISRIVEEEQEVRQQLQDSYGWMGGARGGTGGALTLFGWRLDEFYERISGKRVAFEDKDGDGRKKGTISCAQGNPKVMMQISPDAPDRGKEFHGIQVSGRLPNLYHGTDAAYYIEEETLFRVDNDFLEKIRALEEVARDTRFSFRVGRRNMAEFYYRILPQLQEAVEIAEEQPELIRSYLPPDVRFVFYLDAENGNILCRACAKYGSRTVSLLDLVEDDAVVETFRDVGREDEALYRISQWLPMIDSEHEVLHCGGDQDLVYRMMEHGVDELLSLGEVQCTNRFQNIRVINRVKVSVGVSVSGGMLDLDIATEDISRQELLDLLQSYREKKKYHRLKEGAFVNLEDPSLEMLAELMDTMHLTPREFIKGNMHLPAYRTLYLDRMLEENEGVYSSRDSRFREVVKGFKTVNDADFEEPKSLSRIMRKYQKNGYKWLRTLECWKFGGILADDMGLGKTLQMISVLLAAKEEGRGGTSLVVTPASLVFNWGEEFRRFAPALSVALIAGTQEERRARIEAYQDFDVLVTSYDLLKRDIACYEEKEFQYEIIDEAQYIKNHTTAAAKAVKVVKSRTRFALTGTPIENRLSELWSIFDYLMPGFLYSYEVFRREMELPIVKNQDGQALSRLQKMTAPFILRRLKEDVLSDLPEKLEETRYVRLEGSQQKLYDAQVVRMREMLARQQAEEFNRNRMQILAELTRLRQICCDPSLCFENFRGEAAKVDACLQLVQSAADGGHRMLLFSQFTSMLEILQNKLSEAKIPYFLITGETPKQKRLQLVREFNEGTVPVFLISLKAGGVGLNLTGADVVIHYDPWWNLAAQNQATDRAHRIGQTKKVTVYRLIAKGTIEEKIQKLQETKKDLADQIISAQTGQIGSMSREDFLELLDA